VEDNTLDKSILTRLREIDKFFVDEGVLTTEEYISQTTILHNALLELAKSKNSDSTEPKKTQIGFHV
jgi:hypothetical protein